MGLHVKTCDVLEWQVLFFPYAILLKYRDSIYFSVIYMLYVRRTMIYIYILIFDMYSKGLDFHPAWF